VTSNEYGASLYMFSIFALGERKNGKRKEEKYYFAEGKTLTAHFSRAAVLHERNPNERVVSCANLD